MMSQAEADIREVIHRHGQSDHHPDDVEHAIEALKPFGTDIVPVLTDVLEQGNDDEKLLVLQVLREIDPKPCEIVPVLISLLAEDRLISITATETLGCFESLAVDAVPLIEQQLDSDDDFRRLLSAGAVLKITPGHERAFEVLQAALDSGDEAQRKHASHYLGEIGLV